MKDVKKRGSLMYCGKYLSKIGLASCYAVAKVQVVQPAIIYKVDGNMKQVLQDKNGETETLKRMLWAMQGIIQTFSIDSSGGNFQLKSS